MVKIGLNFKEETSEILHLEHSFVWCSIMDTSENRWEVPWNFEMRCWSGIGKVIRADRVKNEEVLHRVKKEIIILREIKRRKANWIGHTFRRNCLIEHGIEGKILGRIDVTGRRGRWRKQLLDDLKEKRTYWYLNQGALDRTVWRTRFGKGYGSVFRQPNKW